MKNFYSANAYLKRMERQVTDQEKIPANISSKGLVSRKYKDTQNSTVEAIKQPNSKTDKRRAQIFH